MDGRIFVGEFLNGEKSVGNFHNYSDNRYQDDWIKFKKKSELLNCSKDNKNDDSVITRNAKSSNTPRNIKVGSAISRKTKSTLSLKHLKY